MDTPIINAQRKFQLVDTPALPGYCRGCGGSKDTQGVEYFVDLAFFDELGGVYLCNRCLKEIANLYGFYQRTQKVDNQILDLERQIREYESQYSLLRNAGLDVSVLCSYLLDDSISGVPVPTGEGYLEREGNSSAEPDNGKRSNDSRTLGLFKLADGD